MILVEVVALTVIRAQTFIQFIPHRERALLQTVIRGNEISQGFKAPRGKIALTWEASLQRLYFGLKLLDPCFPYLHRATATPADCGPYGLARISRSLKQTGQR